ncbi:MAG TPA: metallophosphoesterase, partial [Candidatus Dormibacteraeota bacterium]
MTGRLRAALARVTADADILLLAGDLTNAGRAVEAELVCEELADVKVPIVAVLGNHDHDDGEGSQIAAMLRAIGVHVLDGGSVTLDLGEVRAGVAGIKGTGGGFEPGATPRTVTESSSGLVESPESVDRLAAALQELDTDVRIALTHYAPVPDTLVGEPPEIWEHLGVHLLGAAVDAGGAHFAVHGHAHHGTEEGRTRAGCPVRNVAQPVIRRP